MELLREGATMASIVGSPEWDAAVEEYAAAWEPAVANGMKGWEHASCDHAEGYCAATATNAFQGA
jgi:hypothetical protein